MSDKTNGFPLKEWIESRIQHYNNILANNNLHYRKEKPYTYKLEELKLLQSALDKWEAEHKEEPSFSDMLLERVYKKSKKEDVCEWLETGISMTHGTRLFTPQCKTFQDMKDKTSYPFAKTDDTCIYCSKKIIEKEV